MDKTTKIYSAPTLAAVGSVITRTLGSVDGIRLEADPMDPTPFVKPNI
ncbi:MAG: hypothetical protein JWL61_660 [Gemmatimonadetes bacterium]|nr:hypothetical protein [Gemmatimonadota bacterium]